MRGQTSPSRSTRARTASSPGCSTGPDACYLVPLPEAGEAKRAILDTYTKEHSAEYQAQAWIDLARKLHGEHPGRPTRRTWSVVINTTHHTHYVIGSGANDPQKYDPTASAARRWTTRSRTSSPSRCRTAPGTTWTPTRPHARPGRTPWSSGARSPRWRTRSGPAATTPSTSREGLRRPRGDHADGRRRSSPTRSPSPTPTRWAPGRSPASSTSTSSAPSPPAWWPTRRSSVPGRRSACPTWPPASWTS